MSWDNITDLYNSSLEADKPFVDSIISEIKDEIENRTTNNLDFFFDYDPSPHLTGIEEEQIRRIIDQVQYTLRIMGVRCKFNGSPIIPPTTQSYNLNISWYIRHHREFMRGYY